MRVNDPDTLREVRAAFDSYETALMSDDLAAMDALFWDSPETVRYGPTENLYGAEAIRAFRVGRGGAPPRTLLRVALTCFGTEVAVVNAEFRREPDARTGRQSQTWVRRPEGWRVVSAHVSLMPLEQSRS